MTFEVEKPKIMNLDGIECYEKDGVVYLKLETVARGLGFVKTEMKNGKEYVTVRWYRVYKYLTELGVPTRGDDGFIPENIFYQLAMKARNKSAKKFQVKIADEVLPKCRQLTRSLENVELNGTIDGIVYARNGKPVTTSRKISEVFQKKHKDVLKMIDQKLDGSLKSAQFCADHITETSYTDVRGRTHREYELDDAGFFYIALGLTGDKADELKIKYITAFDKMRESLNNLFKARIVESVLPQDRRNRQFVYVIENMDNGAIKVGVAQDPEKRLAQLQTGSVSELCLVYQSYVCSNAFNIESLVHQHFEDKHIRGEWYSASKDDVIQYLEQQHFVLKSEFSRYISLTPTH